MLCGSAGWVKKGSSARVAQDGHVGTPKAHYRLVPRGTQIPYPAVVDLAKGYGTKDFVYSSLKEKGLTMSVNGHLPTQCHQEDISDPTRINLNETSWSIQRSIEGMEIQFQSVLEMLKSMRRARVAPQWSKELEIILEELIHLTTKDLMRIFLVMDTMTCWFITLIHLMKVDTKEAQKLEVEEEEV
ncbi:hypothetical protein M9H77_03736 [Catharanthus roseus]|uniref:Uncharacterized protein n=1 Tax=Catharanthus roseus TaxID=4058 RepID=A0ACC0CC04_CATRO|nr:hypothetical protein M9H77_03736 [Catharanthus roseus]